MVAGGGEEVVAVAAGEVDGVKAKVADGAEIKEEEEDPGAEAVNLSLPSRLSRLLLHNSLSLSSPILLLHVSGRAIVSV